MIEINGDQSQEIRKKYCMRSVNIERLRAFQKLRYDATTLWDHREKMSKNNSKRKKLNASSFEILFKNKEIYKVRLKIANDSSNNEKEKKTNGKNENTNFLQRKQITNSLTSYYSVRNAEKVYTIKVYILAKTGNETYVSHERLFREKLAARNC